MRTSFDLPNDLYRTLKARAASSGLKVRELVIRYLEQGLQQPVRRPGQAPRPVPPVMVPSSGHVLRSLTRKQAARLDEEEDLAKHGRSA
ncbi:MAG TPA: hypothetical protein VGA78_11685 [Gemmatimonadales bacterium]